MKEFYKIESDKKEKILTGIGNVCAELKKDFLKSRKDVGDFKDFIN